MSADMTHRRRAAEDWYKTAFNELYPVIYAHRTVEAAAPEARFAIEQLMMRPEISVLDLGCGDGRHLVHLLNCTERAVGLDYSGDLLNLARQMLGRPALLIRADMRAIPFTQVFDAVTSFFTSFGYFPTETENLAVVRGIAGALRIRGSFFLDYMNCDYIEATLVPDSVRESQGYEIHEYRWIDQSTRRINKQTRVQRKGQTIHESTESVQLYSLDQLETLLRRGGLLVDRVFGDYTGAGLDASRPRMILVGHRVSDHA